MAVHDVRSVADEWCDSARVLGEEGERDGAERFSALLDHIESGTRLRRTLDGAASCASSEAERRTIARRLAGLRQAVEQIMDRAGAASPHHPALAARVREWLSENRFALRNIQTESGFGSSGARPGRRRSARRPGVAGRVGRSSRSGPASSPNRLPRSRDRTGSQLAGRRGQDEPDTG